jgi:hypothetical protein
MEKEPSKKLRGVQAHRALAIALGVVFPTKGDLSVFHRHEPVVGDRDAVGIAGEVFEHLLGTAEWRFGIHHPVFVSKWLEPSFPALETLQIAKVSVERELLLLPSPLELSCELAPEEPAQDPDGQKKPVSAAHPLFAVEADAATRNNAVQMRMRV